MALMKLDTSGFTNLLRKLDSLGGDVNGLIERELVKAGDKINEDTRKALQSQNLPAGGRYATGRTMEEVLADQQVRWEGTSAYVPIGFDFARPGAGGYLISGTPRMAPDAQLHRMYRQKRYMREIQNEMQEAAWDEILRLMEG